MAKLIDGKQISKEILSGNIDLKPYYKDNSINKTSIKQLKLERK